MLFRYLLIASASIIPCTNGNAEIDGRIVGGDEVSILRHPYQVSLRRRSCTSCVYAHSCGGSLLDNHTVLTAAHCVYNRKASEFLIVAGTEARASVDGIVTRIERIVPHERYNASITDNDIALLFLSPAIVLDAGKTAAIELATKEPLAGDTATVTGWGSTTEGGSGSSKLLQTRVPIVSNTDCQVSYYWHPITNGMICAGLTNGGKDTCQGDSGGPLVVNGQLAGIVSWGNGCARPNYPGVYANVAYFNDWIAERRAQYKDNA